MDEADRMLSLAIRLQKLGVSQRGTQELLSFPLDVVERQLDYLPYRKAKRPEALIVEAIRFDYSPPLELFHAPRPAPPQD